LLLRDPEGSLLLFDYLYGILFPKHTDPENYKDPGRLHPEGHYLLNKAGFCCFRRKKKLKMQLLRSGDISAKIHQ